MALDLGDALRDTFGFDAFRPGQEEAVTAAVAGWRDHAPRVFPLPHPSWRNTAWLKRNPWFEAELVPELRRTLAEVL